MRQKKPCLLQSLLETFRYILISGFANNCIKYISRKLWYDKIAVLQKNFNDPLVFENIQFKLFNLSNKDQTNSYL
jgi:hypothetical protein